MNKDEGGFGCPNVYKLFKQLPTFSLQMTPTHCITDNKHRYVIPEEGSGPYY